LIRKFVSSDVAIFAALVLAGTPFFIMQSAAQAADVPLAFFYLVSVGLYALSKCKNDYSYTILSGIFCGMALWTKNEAWFFTFSMLLITIFDSIKDKKLALIKNFFVSLLPFLIITISYKLLLAPQNDIYSVIGYSDITGNSTDVNRYLVVFKEFLIKLLGVSSDNFALFIPVLLLFALSEGKFFINKLNTVNFIPVLTLILYFFIYILTPYSLEWHISTSLSRLLLHLYPCFIFLLLAPLKDYKLNLSIFMKNVKLKVKIVYF